ICEKCRCPLTDIKKVYFTSSPSGQTGLRVSLAFLATLQVLNPHVKIYHINTLLLQAGTDNGLSLLTIDSRERKYHLAIYQKKKCLLAPQIISRENLIQFQQQFPDFPVRKDFRETDLLANFQKLKKDFVLIQNIQDPAEKDSGKNWKILGGMIVIVFILAVIIGFWGARKMWAESEAPKKEGITELEKGLGTNRSKLQDYFVIYVPSDGKLLPYIVFKKDHNWGANELYETDKTFYFNCLKDSYREFNTKEEVIEFLRDKDSFF
ncbi:29388_t:CDS:2, partial [Racocetra persica]